MNERTLIRALKDPSSREEAFSYIIKAHQQSLYHHLRKIVSQHEDADDLLQNTFLKAWQNIEGFRGEAKLKTWLFRIATNEALSFLRKRKKIRNTNLEQLQNDSHHSTQGHKQFTQHEITQLLQEAIRLLPPKQCLVFNMKYFEEMRYEEIASITGGSVGSLKASYHHAVRKIELFLKAKLNYVTG